MPTFVPIPIQQKTGECRQHPPVKDKQLRSHMSTIIIPESDGMYTPDLADAAYLPDDLNWRVLTPGQAAKAIANANSHLSPALIITRSWTPKGSYGRRGWAYKHETFIGVEGKSNQRKHRKVREAQHTKVAYNGGCQVCGSIFSTYELQWATAPDGWVLSCTSCAQQYHLHRHGVYSPLDWQGLKQYAASGLCRFPSEKYLYRIFIDLTNGGDIEVSNSEEFEALWAKIKESANVIRDWILARPCMGYSHVDMFTALLHGPGNRFSVLRADLSLIEKVIERLGEFATVGEMLACARELKDGQTAGGRL